MKTTMLTLKSIISFTLLILITLSGNAQTKKDELDLENNERYQKLKEREKAIRKDVKEQPSPYNEKYRNVRLNPQNPTCRDVSKYKTIDNGNIRFLYAFNADDISDPTTYDDLQRLEIGQDHVKYYSGYVYEADSVTTIDLREANEIHGTNFKLGDGRIFIVLPMRGKHQGWSRYLFSEYFKDLSKNEITEYCRMPDGLERYNSYYTEPIPAQEWQICDETIEIAGYQCQKAICRFRGRNYTAWFAMDIPISHGPWKFGGLPGLIMKVHDESKRYVFECVGIEQKTETYPIILLDNYKAYHESTRSKLDKLLKRVCENYYQLSGLTNTISKLLHPYNPMELE